MCTPTRTRQAQEEKDSFITLLEDYCDISMEETVISMGDFNGRVGNEREGIENVIGPFGETIKDIEGETLIGFCFNNDRKILIGFFKHRESHWYKKYRWNQITRQCNQKSIID